MLVNTFEILRGDVEAVMPQDWGKYILPSSEESGRRLVLDSGYIRGTLHVKSYQTLGEVFELRVFNGRGVQNLKFSEFPTAAIQMIGFKDVEAYANQNDDVQLNDVTLELELVPEDTPVTNKNVHNHFLLDDSYSMYNRTDAYNKYITAQRMLIEHMTKDKDSAKVNGFGWVGHIHFLCNSNQSFTSSDINEIARRINESKPDGGNTPLCQRIMDMSVNFTDMNDNDLYKFQVFTDGGENSTSRHSNLHKATMKFVADYSVVPNMVISLMCLEQDKDLLTRWLGVREKNVLGFTNDSMGVEKAAQELEIATERLYDRNSRGLAVMDCYFQPDED